MNYKICPRCGHKIPIFAQYCKYCGIKQNTIQNSSYYRAPTKSHNYWMIGLIISLIWAIVLIILFFGVVRNPKILPNRNFIRQTSLYNWSVKSHWSKSRSPYHEVVEFAPDNRIYSRISNIQGQSNTWGGSYKFYNNGRLMHIHWNGAHQLKGVSVNYYLSKYANNRYYFHAINSNNNHGLLTFTKTDNHKSLTN